MPRQPVDLAAHINQNVMRGHPADFPVVLEPVYRSKENTVEAIPNRRAVVRDDTGEVLAVVSDRYTLVPHQRILDLVEAAIRPLNTGPVPRGIYVDCRGARMRAIFKFPMLAQPITSGDDICPCLKIQNTYDGTSRIAVHIGAFRFVCTNLAIGGGGVFAGGFMSIHAGEVPIEQVVKQLAAYLEGFNGIAALYRAWADQPPLIHPLHAAVEELPPKPREAIREGMLTGPPPTILSAYNAATRYATHDMRSFRGAFDLLARINRAFQKYFPVASIAA